MRSSEAVIPERPDLTEFLKNWYDWHRGYRIIKYDDGREEHQALLGGRLADVPLGHLPRNLDELRSPTVFHNPEAFGRNDHEPSSIDGNPSSLIDINPEDRIFDDDLAIHPNEYNLRDERQSPLTNTLAVRQDHSFISHDIFAQPPNASGRHPTRSFIPTPAPAPVNTVVLGNLISASPDRTKHAEAITRSHHRARRLTHLRQEVEFLQEAIEHVMSEIRDFGDPQNRQSNNADLAESFRTFDQHRVSRGSRRTPNARSRPRADAAALRIAPQQPSWPDPRYQNRSHGRARTMAQDYIASSPRSNPLLEDQEAGYESALTGMSRRTFEPMPGAPRLERPPSAPTSQFPDSRQDLMNQFVAPSNPDVHRNANRNVASLYREDIDEPGLFDPYDTFLDDPGAHLNTENINPVTRRYLTSLEAYAPQDSPYAPYVPPNRDIRRQPYAPIQLNTHLQAEPFPHGFGGRRAREHGRRNAYSGSGIPDAVAIEEPGLDTEDGRPEPQTSEEMKAEQMKQDPACKICFSQPASVALLPCGKIPSGSYLAILAFRDLC